MKIKMLAIATGIVLLSGCAGVASPVGNGMFVTNVQGPVVATTNADVSKSGKACMSNVLGWFATGDASITKAAANGVITEIAVVDHTSFSLLGLYSQYCTVVKGK